MNLSGRKKKREEGFTLIELIIVVAIIGFLMAIAIPRYATSRLVAAQSATKANLHQLATALEVYVTEQVQVPTGYPANATTAGNALKIYIPKAPKTPGGRYYRYVGETNGSSYTIWDPSTPTTGETDGGPNTYYRIGPGGVITIGSQPSGGVDLNW